MSDYVLSATLELKDKLTGKLNDARKGLSGVKSSASDASGALDRVGTSAVKAAADTGRLKSELSGVKSKDVTLRVKDEATSTTRRVQSALQSITGKQAAVGVRDEASPRITHIKEKLSGLAGKPYTAMVNVKSNAPAALGGMRDKLSGVASGMLMNTSVQMAGAAGIGYGIYDTIKTFQNFEAQMSTVQSISGATGAEFDALTAKAQEMGATTQFSATEAGQALEYMAMAGWKTDDMLGGISGIMDLAAASGEDLGRVSDIVTDALTAFGLQASDSAHFADVLAVASSNSNTNVSMMGMTFKYVAPLAGALGYDIEDVATAIGLMANAGIKGEQAGTSLRAVMTRMSDPPKDAAKALDQLGVTIKRQDGTIKPFMETIEELRDRFSGLTDSEKVQMASSIAGQEAMSGFLAIVNASESDFAKLAGAIDHADGAAKKMAELKNNNLAGDLKALSSAWEALQLKIMKSSGAASGLRSLAQSFKGLVDTFNSGLEKGLGTAVLDTALRGVKSLKDEFLELNGVGSILAGGALAAGLYKIISLARRAASAVKGLAGATTAAKSVGGAASSATASTAQMTVSAGTVVVNGRSVVGGAGGLKGGTAAQGVILGPDGRPISSKQTTTGPVATPPARSRSAMFRTAGAGAGIAALFSAVDLYSTRNENNERLQEAAYGVEAATADLNRLQADGGTKEEFVNATKALADAQQYQAMTIRDNRVSMGKAAGSAIGSTAGTIIGGAIGSLAGPMGTMLGMTAGGIIGEIAGNKIGGLLSDYAPTMGYNTGSDFNARIMRQLAGEPEPEATYFSNNGDFQPEYDFTKSPTENVSDQQNANTFGFTQESMTAYHGTDNPAMRSAPTQADDNPYLDAFSNAGEGAGENDFSAVWGERLENLKNTFVEAWQSIHSNVADEAEGMSDDVVTTVDETGAEIETSAMDSEANTQGIWGVLAPFFSGSVASPMESSADDAGSGIADAFGDAADDTEAAWGDEPGWFDSSVYSPIEGDAASCGPGIAAGINSGIKLIENAWSGVKGFFSNLFSFIQRGAATAASAAASIPGSSDIEGKAIGTSFAPGGWTEVNEHGGEIIDLPTGSRVYPHATTVSMLKDMFSDLPDKPLVEPQLVTTGLADIGSLLDESLEALKAAPVQTISSQLEAAAPTIQSPQIPDITVTTPSATANGNPVNVTITGNTFTVREEADIDRIAYKLLELMQQARSNINPLEGALA